ncbi:MAG: 5-carboxymethyl-2-hydroxymuconate isomerase [Paracoccaceae bacterium]
MPHFHIEYTKNLADSVDMAAFCEVIRSKAASIATFPMAGIRVRAICVDHYAIADGDPKHGFIDISIRLREGRDDETKADAATQVFDAARAFLAPVMATRSIALSLEMRDINAALSPKYSTIRDHLEVGK